MPHINLPEGYPGIRSLFMYSPGTAQPLNLLVQTLLHDPETSTRNAISGLRVSQCGQEFERKIPKPNN